MTTRRKRHTMSTGEIAIRSFLIVEQSRHTVEPYKVAVIDVELQLSVSRAQAYRLVRLAYRVLEGRV